MTPRDTLSRLHAGWRPDCRDIASAEVVEDWQLSLRDRGPYMLQGVVSGQSCQTSLLAIDPGAGWALASDRLLVLGRRAPEACIAVSPDEVMHRASEMFEVDGQFFGIRTRTLDLAGEARQAGFDTAGYLLEMAALAMEKAVRTIRGTQR